MDLPRTLGVECVKDLPFRDALVVEPETPISDAITLLQEEDCGCVVVVSGGRAVGIFTERDVLRRVIGEQVGMDSPIKEVMSTDLATVRATDPIARAIDLLHVRGLRHLPVVDDRQAPIGVVSVRRVMEYLVEHFPEAVYNQPSHPASTVQPREGA